MITLHIPRWHPTSTNRLMRMHWAKRGRMLKWDKDLVGVYWYQSHHPDAKGKRRMSITYTLGPNQSTPQDADNGLKSLLDALVACGALVDDAQRWCELGAVRFKRGRERGTTIHLEDI